MDYQLNRFYIVVSWFPRRGDRKWEKWLPVRLETGKIATVKDKVSNFQSAVNGAVVDHVSVLCLGPEVEAVRRRREVLKLDVWVFFKDFKYFNLIAFLLKISSLSIKEESGPLELHLGRRYEFEPAMLA